MSNPGILEVSIAVAVAMYALKWALEGLSAHRNSTDRRETGKDSHITTQHSNADSLIAEMLRQSTLEGRKDYLRLESKMDEIRDDFAKMAALNVRLTSELEYSAKRDVEFHDRQLPAILKRAAYRDMRIDSNRDSINEVRSHLRMPLVGTPVHGVRIPDSIPVPIDDHPSSAISPHDVAGKKE